MSAHAKGASPAYGPTSIFWDWFCRVGHRDTRVLLVPTCCPHPCGSKYFSGTCLDPAWVAKGKAGQGGRHLGQAAALTGFLVQVLLASIRPTLPQPARAVPGPPGVSTPPTPARPQRQKGGGSGFEKGRWPGLVGWLYPAPGTGLASSGGRELGAGQSPPSPQPRLKTTISGHSLGR